MHDALNAGLAGRLEKNQRVPNGVGVLEQSMIEAHPVGVVEDRHALQVPDEPVRLLEVEGIRLDPVAEGVGPG
jgi:hypothetical protein